MKIVCDACQAKYSISDDKVQGKVFKIRCKKCSNIIVVRGGAGAAEQPAQPAQEKDTRVYDYGHEGAEQQPSDDDAVWHVVVNQDQVGPMTAAEVQQRFAAGEIDGETYAWREGFADWLPLSQVDVFASYVAAGSTAVSSSGAGAAAVAAMFGGGDEGRTVQSDPGDLFATASTGADASDDDGDLFGRKPAAAAAAHAERSASASASKLRGERNENSVLFSLNNLAQLASDRPAPSASVQSAPSGHATGAAGGEGSGLIDIRSMASAYLGGGGGGAVAKPAASSIGSIDDLPVFGGGGFSEPAVIVPVAQRSNNNKMMYALIGSIGVLAIAAVIMVVVLLTGGDSKPATVAASDKQDDSSDKSDDKGDDKADEKPDDKVAGGDGADDKPADSAAGADPKPADTVAATAPTPAAKPDDRARDARPSTRPDPKPRDARPSARPEPKPPAATASKPAEAGGCDEVSCVLNEFEGACCARYKKGGGKTGGSSASKGSSDLPSGLDRNMIQDGVSKVKARVTSCGDRSSAKGQVKVSVKVSGSGSVTSVTVKATPDASLGNCVASAMQKASFAKTQNGGSFSYPFNF